jgi:hypothetical protein
VKEGALADVPPEHLWEVGFDEGLTADEYDAVYARAAA